MRPSRKQRLNPDTVVLLKRIFTGVLVIALFSLLIVAVWYGTRIKSLTIDTVAVTGGKTIKHSEVEVLVKQELKGTYLGIVPRQFAWLYPEADIRRSIASIERIHNISVSRINRSELVVNFDEFTPRALWCESVGSDKCLFLDNEGYAFSTAPKLSGGSFLRFVKSEQPIVIRESFDTSETFNIMLTFANLLAERGWFVSTLELDQVGDVFLHLADGSELKVSVNQSPTEVVDNLMVILQSNKFSHLKPGNFQYIDLRFGNKVFVKEEATQERQDGETMATSTVEIE